MTVIRTGPEPKPRLLCRLFGHRWFEFDHDWCSRSYFMCRRCKIVKHECNNIKWR